MSDPKPLHFVVLLGSLRKNSLNRAVAEALPLLAPEELSMAGLSQTLPDRLMKQVAPLSLKSRWN